MSEVLTKIVVDCSTGEQRIENLSEAEIAQRELDAQAYAEQQALAEAEAVAKAEAKASAESKLALLGLTPDEISALTA